MRKGESRRLAVVAEWSGVKNKNKTKMKSDTGVFETKF